MERGGESGVYREQLILLPFLPRARRQNGCTAGKWSVVSLHRSSTDGRMDGLSPDIVPFVPCRSFSVSSCTLSVLLPTFPYPQLLFSPTIDRPSTVETQRIPHLTWNPWHCFGGPLYAAAAAILLLTPSEKRGRRKRYREAGTELVRVELWLGCIKNCLGL